MEKFIFLDRDGVINRDPGWVDKDYVASWEEFQFLPGALEAIRKLRDNGYKVVAISNQAGVGRGVYTKEKLDEITGKMLRQIEDSGGEIHSVQYCIHKKEDNCGCRKPKTGLFKKATEGFRVDFEKTYFIGDTKQDIEAGRNIGANTILVLSGKVKDEKETEGWEIKPDFIKKDLMEAVKFITREDSSH